MVTEFKVSLIGASKTGKSTFVRDLVHRPQPFPTLGAHAIPYQIDAQYRMHLWDCGGDSRFIGLGPGYIQDSDLVLVFGDAYVEWVPPHVPYRMVTYQDKDALLQVILSVLMPKKSRL